MFDLGEAEVLEDRWDVVAEAAAVALAESVPATDGVVGGAGPGLDGAGLGYLLFVRVAEGIQSPWGTSMAWRSSMQRRW